ncbi:hypothetical protein HPB52_015367 [Rhipicephalus sanguineus]|uniref:RRM domain-containing protein n=1 Tax=Rhipicephalus sanguineus TaxID=34632 RepID=A0A9D4PFB9_RHISA|nr:hypothetical protein HPB52_015367 [Rhipicephalus sanguineus]
MNSPVGKDQPDPDAIKMFVGQIPRSWDESDLKKMFEDFGPVYQINVLRDKATGTSRGLSSLSLSHYWLPFTHTHPSFPSVV